MASRHAVLAIILVVGTALLYTQAQTTQNPSPTTPSSTAPLENKDVLELVKAQLPADVIIAKIQGSPCSFDGDVPETVGGERRSGSFYATS
jgi:hypothetical protein